MHGYHQRENSDTATANRNVDFTRAIFKGTLRCNGAGINGDGQIADAIQFRQMEDSALLIRTAYPEVPPRVEYTLTELGHSLKPVLDATWNWGEEYKAKNI